MNTMETLKEKIRELEKALEKEKIAHEKTKKENEHIQQEKEHLEKEFEEFKAKHALTVAHLQKVLKIKKEKKYTHKPFGAKKGHKGYARRIPKKIDQVITLNPLQCPDCHSTLQGNTQEIRKRYVTDIKLLLPAETIQYEIHRKYCRQCKKLVEPIIPKTLPRAKYGLNIMLLIMYLKVGLRLPGNKICEFLLTMYTIQISEGEIACILKQLQKSFGAHYKLLQKLVKTAKIKHTDWTGWKINGNAYIAWTFITAGTVIYKITKKANTRTAMTVFGKKQQENILVVDRHSVCLALATKAGFLLQLCWAHILQDSKDLAKNFGNDGKYIHKKLKKIYALATAMNHKGTEESVILLQKKVFALTKRHYTSTTVRRFVNNLWKRDHDNLFRFVTNPDINPTNNISERELRALVIIRKISNGSRSKKGANITAELLSIIQTMRMKKENILLGLHEILAKPSLH